jgi:hypothetical protein
MKQDLFLEEARLGPRNPVLVEHDEAPRLPHLRRYFRDYVLVDLAHVAMLREEGIVDGPRGARLLKGLLDSLDLGATAFHGTRGRAPTWSRSSTFSPVVSAAMSPDGFRPAAVGTTSTRLRTGSTYATCCCASSTGCSPSSG